MDTPTREWFWTITIQWFPPGRIETATSWNTTTLGPLDTRESLFYDCMAVARNDQNIPDGTPVTVVFWHIAPNDITDSHTFD